MFKPAEEVKYSEENQSFPLLFAWVRKEDQYIAQHSWVKCRDFLGDAVYLKKKEDYTDNIYRFKIEPDFQITNILALKFPSPKTKNIFLNTGILNLINVEEKNTLSATKIEYVEDNVVVISFDPFWLKHNVLISFYTFLIKIFSYSKDNHFENCPATEQMYVLSVKKLLPKLLDNLSKLDYPVSPFSNNLPEVHNNSGFVSVFKQSSLNPLKKQLEKL